MTIRTLSIFVLLLVLQGCQARQYAARIPHPPCVQSHEQLREYGIDLLCWYDKHVSKVLPPRANFDPFILEFMHDAMKRRASNARTLRYIYLNAKTSQLDVDTKARLVFGANLVLKTEAECPAGALADQERELLTIQKMQQYDHNLASMADVDTLVTNATNGTFSAEINADILRDYAYMTSDNMRQGSLKYADNQMQHANNMLLWIGRHLLRGPNEQYDLPVVTNAPPTRADILNAINEITPEVSTSKTYLELQRAYPDP